MLCRRGRGFQASFRPQCRRCVCRKCARRQPPGRKLSLGSVVEALKVMVQASSIDSLDAAKLTVLMKNAQNFGEGDDLDAVGAHAAAAYQSHSGSIVETLEDLQAALCELAASQVATTKLRAKRKDAFAKNKQDLEDDIDGVRTALAAGEEAQESLDCSDFSTKRQ